MVDSLSAGGGGWDLRFGIGNWHRDQDQDEEEDLEEDQEQDQEQDQEEKRWGEPHLTRSGRGVLRVAAAGLEEEGGEGYGKEEGGLGDG
jgi:hypothetical protein